MIRTRRLPSGPAACLLLLFLVVPISAAGDETLADRIDAFVQPYLDAGHLSGNLLVARGGDVLVERSFGLANHELQVPNSPRTRFAIASISKPITLALLAILVEQEVVGVADPVSKWIQDFPRGDDITLLHLANHTAGIPHRLTEPHEECIERSAADMVDLVRDKGLIQEPGGDRIYSSGGFAVLARVLELAAGAPYEDLVQRHVFGPAGMTRSLHPAHRVVIPDRASSYRWHPGGLRNSQPKDLSFLVGGGSIYSTASDLWLLLRAVVDGNLGETVPQFLVRGRSQFGWNGVTGGYRAFVQYDAETEIAVVFTTNVVTGVGDRLRSEIPRLVAGEPVESQGPPAFELASRPTAELVSYEGRYELRPGSILQVRAREGMLYSNDWLMIPVDGEHRFFSIQDYNFVTFVFGEDGFIQRMDWGETPWEVPRVGDL